MTSRINRPMPVRGLGTVKGRPASAGDRLKDSDRMMIEAGDCFCPFPGGRRRGMKLRKSAVQGPGTVKDCFGYDRHVFQVMSFPNTYIDRHSGHGLAVVDTVPALSGRIVSLAHHNGGLLGSQLVSRADYFGTDGLNDAQFRGVYTGTAPIILKVQIDGEGTPDTFKWSVDNGATWGATGVSATGDWQDLQDGIQFKLKATTGHTNNDFWRGTAGARPSHVADLYRMGPHNYPFVAGGRTKSLISTAYNRVLVDDGNGVREAGIEAPHIRPRIVSDVDEEDVTDLGDTDAASVSWVLGGAATGVVVTRVASPSSSPDPTIADGRDAVVRVEIPKSNSGKDTRRGSVDLAYHNLSVAHSIPMGTNRVRLRIYPRIRHSSIDKNKLKLVFSTTDALAGTVSAGTRVEIKIGQKLRRGEWFDVDVPWPVKDADFSCKSVGIRLAGSLDKGLFDSDGKAFLYLDHLFTDEPELGGTPTAVTSDLFAGDADWFIRFAWMRGAQVGALSPWSESLRPNGHAIKADLSGDYPGIDAGLRNSPPEGVTGVMVFLATSSTGGDPRLGGQGLSFFRFSPPEGTKLEDLDSPSAGQLILTITDELQKAFALSFLNERDPFFHAQPRPGNFALQDGGAILTGNCPAYSVGEWTWTDGSHIITPVDSGEAATTPWIGKWMEGRRIAREGESDVFRILKTLDMDGDGILDALWIGQVFDAKTQDLEGAYEGTTGDGKGIILAERGIKVTNVTTDEGQDVENSSYFNDFDPMPPEDFPLAAFKTDGETLWVMGYNNAAILRQNSGALADLPIDSGVPYSNPVHFPGIGLAGPRAWRARPDGTVLGLTSKGEYYVFSSSGAKKHPASDRFAGVLSGRGFLVSTEGIDYAFLAFLKPDAEQELIYSGFMPGVASSPSPGVTINAQPANDFETEATLPGGELDPADFTYDMPWPVDNRFFWGLTEGEGSTDGENMPMVHIEAWDPCIGPSEPWNTGGDDGRSRGFWVRGGGDGAFDADLAHPNSSAVDIAIERDPGGSPPSTVNPVQTDAVNSYWPDSTYHLYSFGNPITTGVGSTPNATTYYARLAVTSAPTIGPLAEYFHGALADGQGGVGTASRSKRVIAANYIGHYIYVKGMASPTPQDGFLLAGTLGWRFRFDPTNPGNGDADPSRVPPDASYDRSVTINQNIPLNTWVFVAMPTPAWNHDAAWTDKFGVKRPGVLHDRVVLELLANPYAGMVPDSGNFQIFVSGGRQFTGFAGDDEVTQAPVDPFEPCACADATTEHVDEIEGGRDFGFGALISMANKEIFPASQCKFSCALAGPPQGCAIEGTLSGAMFLGDIHGYVWQFADHLLGWGTPQTRNVFDVSTEDPGNVNQVNIGGAWSTGEPLDVDIDGDSLLPGLVVAKISDTNRTVEFRVIYSQSGDSTILVEAPAFDNPPVAGDQIIIGALPYMMQWPEVRCPEGSRFERVTMDLQYAQTSTSNPETTVAYDPVIVFEVFTAAAGKIACDFSAPAARKVFRASALTNGNGWVTLPVRQSRAVSVRLTILQGMESRVVAGNIQFDQVFGSEEVR